MLTEVEDFIIWFSDEFLRVSHFQSFEFRDFTNILLVFLGIKKTAFFSFVEYKGEKVAGKDYYKLSRKERISPSHERFVVDLVGALKGFGFKVGGKNARELGYYEDGAEMILLNIEHEGLEVLDTPKCCSKRLGSGKKIRNFEEVIAVLRKYGAKFPEELAFTGYTPCKIPYCDNSLAQAKKNMGILVELSKRREIFDRKNEVGKIRRFFGKSYRNLGLISVIEMIKNNYEQYSTTENLEIEGDKILFHTKRYAEKYSRELSNILNNEVNIYPKYKKYFNRFKKDFNF